MYRGSAIFEITLFKYIQAGGEKTSRRRESGAARRALCVGLVAFWVCILSPLSAAFAQSEMASAQARTAQYVFVIDDSGSMSRQVGGDPAADPDRLAVFAVRSTLSMLDDVDEATIVRLNGALDGEPVIPVAPLSENRDALEKSLALSGTLAEYGGAATPCARSFARAKEALNAAYRPNVAQVMIFLTDGACTGKKPSNAEFLKGLKSAEDELFKFYLLRFESREYTRELAGLAEQTGGESFKTSAADPTAILKPFASALSRSQGYESYLLTPQDHVLDAHKGARRVRLLAVAPDKGQDLEFSIDPARKGEKPKLLGSAKTGLHQYEDGRRYRYAALDYRPGTVPVSVKVKGAGGAWKVVAVPEYRLFVDMDVSLGGCGAQREASRGARHPESVSYAEVGSQICVQVRLVNEDGEPVTSDVASRGTEARVRYSRPGDKEAAELPAKRRGEAAVFEFERANLIKGDHIIRPVVRLAAPGQQGATVTIKGAAHGIQVTSLTISAHPTELDFGALLPGSEAFSDVKISGNFPANRARLVVQNRDALPECVRFALSGVGEQKTQKITPGQSYKVGVDVAPYCGTSSFTREIQTALRIEFDPAGQALRPPTLVLPVRFSLVNKLSAPKKLSASVAAGDSAPLKLRVGGNFKKDAKFNVLLPPVDQRQAWPSDGDALQIQFLDAAGEPVFQDGKPAERHAVRFEPGSQGDALELRVVSDACCQGGTYRTELVLAPTAGTKEPIRVPVEISVEAGSIWSCWGPLILWILAALLVLLLVLYIYNMFRNSSFLSKKRLAGRLSMLEWDATGMPVGLDGGPRKVRNIVDKYFTFGARARAWFAANPLKLGLPNDYKYDETVRIMLNADQPQLTRLKVLEKVDHYHALEKRPIVAAHIFISKKYGFYGVPDDNGYFGEFRYAAYMGSMDGEPERVDLNNAKLLLEDSRRMQGTFAGWKTGY